jgi:hypothetical protein
MMESIVERISTSSETLVSQVSHDASGVPFFKCLHDTEIRYEDQDALSGFRTIWRLLGRFAAGVQPRRVRTRLHQ